MPLCTERSNAHLIVATDCIVSFSPRNENKDSDLVKRGSTVVHLIAAQKFLLEVTVLSARNVDHDSYGDKIICY
jgi:hypothetical protein